MITGTGEPGAFIREKYKPACGSPFGAILRNEVTAGIPGLLSDGLAPRWPVKKLATWARSLKIHNHTARSHRRAPGVVARMKVDRTMMNGENEGVKDEP